jgi:thioredoxin 2
MLRPCPLCGVTNRIPGARLSDKGRCGACKGEFPPLNVPLDVTGEREFDEIVKGAKVPVLVDFWAAWCGPCRMVAPEVARAASELAGRAVVLKVDTEQNPELAARYQVRSIPNFAVFYGGAKALQQAGAVDGSTLRRWVEKAASNG